MTSRRRRRGSRGFRDVEGEAIAVAAKVSELVRKKDMLEALRVARLVQVSSAPCRSKDRLVAIPCRVSPHKLLLTQGAEDAGEVAC